MRVLIAEDDKPVASFVQKGLEAEQYAVDIAQDGDEAQFMVGQIEYDVAVLDLTLPRLDGLEVLKHIRETKPALPVLILTGRNRVEDRVKGLDLGADDYLTKPFSFTELSARVRALCSGGQRCLRRSCCGSADLELNRVERVVKRAGNAIELTPKEFSLLEYLMRNVGRCVTRAMIIEHVWNLSFDTMTNVVDVYINYLRKKVDQAFEHKLIHTVRGVGYQIGEEA